MKEDKKYVVPDSIKQVGVNIRDTAKKKDIKLRYIAEDCDMDVEVLRRYVNGKNVMRLDRAMAIAKALGIDMNELCKGAF